MQLVIKKIVPATIESNINQLDIYITELQNRYANVIVTEEFITEGKEDRAKLNKLKKNLADERKKIEKDGLSDVQKFILKIKEAEKTVGTLSENINNQIKKFENEEKEKKLNEIKEIKDELCLIRNVEYGTHLDISGEIVDNPRWTNKGFKKAEIEKEIKEQVEKIKEKYDFIMTQIEIANEDIETKIIFSDIVSKFKCNIGEIVKFIAEKKLQIKTTEENIRKKAEEDKQKAIKEAEEKAEKEKQKAIEEAKEEERKKIEHAIEKNENPEHFRSTDDIEKKEKLTTSKPVQSVASDVDYVALVIKIKNSDFKKAIKLREFLDSDDMKLGYDKYIIPSFTDEKIHIEKDEDYEDVAEESKLLYVREEYGESRRWSIKKYIYYKRESDGRIFGYWKEEPATEMQEGGDFASSDCFYEVKQDIKINY